MALNWKALPAWAAPFDIETKRDDGKTLLYPNDIAVDCARMYPALLDEYRKRYPVDGPHPQEFLKKEKGQILVPHAIDPEWKAALTDLHGPDLKVSAYWLEVVYQASKMILQISMQTFAMTVHHNNGAAYCQAERSPGRGPDKAAGGTRGGREAREHFKRLRGFVPS